MDYGALAPPTAHSGWQAFASQAEAAQARIILLTTKATGTLWDFRFRGDDILLMGRESAGVPDDVYDASHARLRIPLAPHARSLNVHVAAAIALAEVRRQIGWEP